MNKSDIEKTLVNIFENYTNSNADINCLTSLREEIGLSSFDMISMGVEIESSFSINIDNVNILAEIDTVGDVVDLISEKIAKL